MSDAAQFSERTSPGIDFTTGVLPAATAHI
jgi:hypothetical protein